MWLDWQACQLDTPPCWVELTVIPDVEDPRKLDWKIHAAFLILAARCEALPGHDYILLPAPNVSPGVGFSPMILPIRMSGGSPCY